MLPTTLSPFAHRTKTQAITAYLTEMAHQRGPEARLPTIQQLCTELQVSVVTLNRALSELEAQNIITRKHGVGIFVSTRLTTKTIGLVYDRDIFQPSTSPFAGLLIEEARRRADAGHEAFSLFLAEPNQDGAPVHDDLVEAIHAHKLNGVILVGEGNPAAAQWLEQRGIPLVALAYTPIAAWRVKIDHAETVRIGTESLLRQGCRRPALVLPVGVGIGRRPGENTFPEQETFEKTLRQAGLPFQTEQIRRHGELDSQTTSSTTNQEQGFQAASELFVGENRPDGLVIADDMMARGALVALAKLGLRPGNDVKIATHLNKGSTALHGYEDDLTIIDIDPAKIVSALFAMLETLMSGGTPVVPVENIRPELRSGG